MTTVRKAIRKFLSAKRSAHNGPDLIDRVLGCAGAELQVNVAAGNGEPVAGKRNTYSDGVNEWWNIRIPKNANCDPSFDDYELRWPLDEHVEAIGSTGWDWEQKVSRCVGFDFDSIAGHAIGVGVTDEKIAEIKKRAAAVGWVEVRKSTGGGGLHLYEHLDSVPTANHTEHAALARHVLGLLSTEAGFDFAANVDCCGGNMWLWHRKSTPENEGLKLLKAATRTLSESELVGWRDHVDVVTRKRTKVKVSGMTAEFEEIAAARKSTLLDSKHLLHIDALREAGYAAHWVADFGLLQTHTRGFAEIDRDKCGIVGLYQTNSPGGDPHAPNCFAFPIERGAWKVYRFSPGIAEAPTWEQDGIGFTWCYFNRRPGLDVCKAFNGIELQNGKGYEFESAAAALKAVEALGHKLSVPDYLLSRSTTLKRNSDGRLVIEIRKETNDPPLPSWAGATKKHWVKIINQNVDVDREESADERVRVLVAQGKHAGVVVRNKHGGWDEQPLSLARTIFHAEGFSSAETSVLIGREVQTPWRLEANPFQPEYPGDRRWNRDAAQFKIPPAAHRDGVHTHWDLILNHAGQTLTPRLKELEWAKQANIRTGADYLRAVMAAIIRHPFEPTPYLFFYGPEESGKSIVWEAHQELFTKGVVKADGVLNSTSDFNGQLVGAILCVVEEKDINRAAGALNKIKDYVTTRTLSIRQMRTDAYQIPNTTHWFQFSNDPMACPIFPGDTRITSIEVPSLPDGQQIPKEELLEKLRTEAPAYLRTLLDITLPARTGRLRIPIVETDEKSLLAEDNAPLLAFIKECLVFNHRARVPKLEVYSRYLEWAQNGDESPFNRVEFFKQMKQAAPRLRTQKLNEGTRPQAYVGVQLVDDVRDRPRGLV